MGVIAAVLGRVRTSIPLGDSELICNGPASPTHAKDREAEPESEPEADQLGQVESDAHEEEHHLHDRQHRLDSSDEPEHGWLLSCLGEFAWV